MGLNSFGCLIKGQTVTGGGDMAALIAVLSPKTANAAVYTDLAAARLEDDFIANMPVINNLQSDIAFWETVFNYFEIVPAEANLAALLAAVLAHDEEPPEQTRPTPEELPPPVYTPAEENELNILASLIENIKLAGDFADYGEAIPRAAELAGIVSLEKIAVYLGLPATGSDDEIKSAISIALGF